MGIISRPQGYREGPMSYICEKSSLALRSEHYTLLSISVFERTRVDQDLCLSVCLWLMNCEISSPHRKKSLSLASLAPGSRQVTSSRHWPWKGARAAGHFIWEFHPVAMIAPNTIFLLKWFPPPSSSPSPNDLCLTEGFSPS